MICSRQTTVLAACLDRSRHVGMECPVMNNSALSVRRWAVIVAAALSGIIVLVSMFADPVPGADGPELIQGYAANEGRQGLHTNLIHYGFALFAPVAYAMVGLVRRRGAWIANVAGLFAVVGLSTLPGLVLTDYVLVGVEHAAGLDAAVAAEAATENLPGFTALAVPAVLASVLAVPVAVLALWRAGLVPWWLPVVAAATFLAPNVIPGWLIGFSMMAAGMLSVAWALSRIPEDVWHTRSVSDPVGTKDL
jgi:hypothetical protein